MSFVGASSLGIYYRIPIATGLVHAILPYVLTPVGIYVAALIIAALAPSFDSKKKKLPAMKVAVFSFTLAWIGGSGHTPMLATLVLLASLYSLYLYLRWSSGSYENPERKGSGIFCRCRLCNDRCLSPSWCFCQTTGR